MVKRRIATIFVTVMIGASATFVPSIPAVAAPSPTPNGFTGASNMVESVPGAGHTGVPQGGGMVNAMSVDAPQGNAGMNTAVTNSSGGSH